MATFKVRDKDGKVIPIPALRGKTAYEYAKDGGYTGTEEEFKKKMMTECVPLPLHPVYGTVMYPDRNMYLMVRPDGTTYYSLIESSGSAPTLDSFNEGQGEMTVLNVSYDDTTEEMTILTATFDEETGNLTI